MPLSEEELRLLEQMERALVEEDPKFASTLRGTSLRRSAHRKVALATVGFVVGVVVMMTGVIAGGSSTANGLTLIVTLGIVGFLIMLGSATFGLAAMRSQRRVGPVPAQAPDPEHPSNFTLIQGSRSRTRRRQRSSASFMDRMETRWRRRREQGF